MLNTSHIPSQRKFLTPEEIAKELRVSKRTVVRWVQQGTLAGYHIGTLIRIPEESFKDMLQEHWTGSQEEI